MKKIGLSILLILLASQSASLHGFFFASGQAAEIPGMSAPSQSGLYGIYVILRQNGPGKMKVDTLMALVRHPLVQQEIRKAPDNPPAAHEAIFELIDKAQTIYGGSE